MRRLKQLLIPTLFFGLIFAPAVGLLRGQEIDTIENRRLTDWPEPGPGFFEQLTLFLQDRLPLRAEAIQAHAWVALNILGDSPTPNVMLGTDGWLFFTPDVMARCDADDRDLRARVAGIVHFAEMLRAHGKRFLMVLAPNKTSIYRDHWSRQMERRIDAACLAAREARIRELFAATGPGILVDLWTPLRQASAASAEPIYTPTDTHWNDRGMVVAVHQIVETLDPDLWDDAEVVLGDDEAAVGDLSRFTGRPSTEMLPRLRIRRPGTEVTQEVRVTEPNAKPPVGYIIHRASGPPRRLGKVVFTFDSFFLRTWELLPPYFDEIDWFSAQLESGDPFPCEIATSQTVVFTMVERNFYLLYDRWWDMEKTTARTREILEAGPEASGCAQWR